MFGDNRGPGPTMVNLPMLPLMQSKLKVARKDDRDFQGKSHGISILVENDPRPEHLHLVISCGYGLVPTTSVDCS